MTGTFDEDDYLAPASGGVRIRPVWLRLGLPVVAIFLVAGGIAAAIGLTTENIYQADAQIELMVPEGLAPDASVPAPSRRIDLARSSAVASQAVDDLALLQDARFLTLHPALDTSEADEADLRQRAAAIVLRNMGTGTGDVSSFGNITYRSPDPALAADIANGLAVAFLPADAQQVAGAMGDTRTELQGLVDEIRAELETAERDLAEGMEDADIVALPEEEADLVTVAGSDAYSAQERQALESQLAQVQERLRRVEADIANGATETDDPVITRLRESRDQLQSEYERITEQFRADYPAALDMREQIDVIDATLAREQVRLAEDRAAEAQQLRIQQTDLLARIETLGYQVAARNTAGLGLGDAQQDITAKQELYNLLVARLAAEEETTLPTTARVIASAVTPSRPVVPNWPILIGAAAGIALLLSLLVVWLDRRRGKTRARR